jgi:glycosyltransferase involved in cell wall biosynthesis
VLVAHTRYRTAGGEERYVDLLESGLRQIGVPVQRFERRSSELDRSLSKRLISGITLAYRPGAGGIQEPLEAWSPSVVHFNNIWPLLTPSALLAAKRSGAAVVCTVHNYRFACPGGTLLRQGVVHEDCIEGSSLRCGLRGSRDSRVESVTYGIALAIQRRMGMLARWTDAFVAPSRFMAEMLVRSGIPRNSVHVIPNGVPETERRQSVSARDYVLFVGRMAPEKGIRTLLAASREVPKIPFAFAGDGPIAEEVQSAGGNVRYLGRLDGDGLRSALDRAAFTVVPSEWYENCPLALLESMAAGRPAVVTDIGGLSEIVDEGSTGVSVPPADPGRLAQAIAELWGDPGRAAAMGEAARRAAETHYSLRAHIDRLMQVYKDAVSSEDTAE